jgi:hypothetical protein
MKLSSTQGLFLGSLLRLFIPATTGLLAFFAFTPALLKAQTPQALPFSQNWSNINLITVNDVWSGVPGIIGFRGDDLVAVTGVDPQTVLGPDNPGVVDVNANQNNPNNNSAGGVTEFDGIANPVVALQGSGTADAPYIRMSINTLSRTNITVSYIVRDIDGSADNAVQQVALQYRIGNSGNFTNIPAGYIADATTVNADTLVTAINVVLPAAANNQAEVQLRIITTNAVGNDEWVGIDNISITGALSCNLSIGSSVTQPTCANNDGAINLTVSNGAMPFTYAWTGPGVNAGSEDQSGLAAGTYNVTVTDAAGCTAAAAYTLVLPPGCNCNISVSAAVTPATCNSPGAIQFTAANGVAPYSYTLSNGSSNNTGLFNNLPGGQYAVTVSDNGNCSAVATATVPLAQDNQPPTFNQNPLPANVTISCDAPVPPPAVLTASDNCDNNVTVTLTSTNTPGNCPQNRTVTRTWIATDDAGNTAVHTQILTIRDNTPPVFNQPLPANVTLSCDAPLPAAPQVTAADNCDPGQVPPVIFINEIHYDNLGADVNEFIEVAGTAGIDLTQYALVLYNGNGGVEYGTTNLTGTIDNEGNGFGAVAFSYPVNGIQNGAPDGVALVKLPNTVVQFLSYEGVFTATNGPAAGLVSSDIGVLEDGANPVGTSLQLTGTGQQYGNFNWVGPITATAGTLNNGQTINPLPGTIIATLMESSMMGNCPGEMIYKRMWTATDACGNATSYMQTINLLDGAAPTFVPPLPQNITISCNTPIPPPATLLATDNCDDGAGDEIVWINEIHYDNVGTDVNEFIEVAGTSGTNLSNYTLFLYNGTGGGTYGTLPLTGVIDNESNGYGAVAFTFPVNGLQNGSPDGVALVRGGMVVQFLSYEGTFVAVGGPANGMTSTDIGVQEDGLNPVGTSLSLTGMGGQYGDFVWNPPAPESPGAINPGQSFVAMPVGLMVSFSQSIAPIPGPCPNDSTITRTWTVSDGCGNATTHVQVITVADNTPPVVTCQAITVNLDLDGEVTVNQNAFPYNATDNCSSALTLLPNAVTINCSNSGASVPFTLRVQDQCGNIGVCNTQINVPAFSRCIPEISIADPCVCKNNATDLTNGQFSDRIYIRSLTGKIWTITQVIGLYADNSPAPPTAPIPLAPGVNFTESPAGSGDYFLRGLHIDDQGYAITVRSQQGEILTISNKCAYPNPVITSDLSGPFCLYSDPVTLTANPGDANIVSDGFKVNGVPATVFNPGAGIGQYVIEYTVNGGTPKAAGPNDPGCEITIRQIVQVIPTPSVVSCNDLVQISLDEDCSTEITPDMILEGSYGCFDDYSVNVTSLNGAVNFGNTVTVANLGQTLKVTVKHLVSGNTCWGTIIVEDKLPPVLTCTNIDLSCVITDFTPNYLSTVLNIAEAFPQVNENCTNYTLHSADTWFDLGCTGSINGIQNVSAYVRRVWTATDASGNQSQCTQFLYLRRRNVQNVLLPADVTLSCNNPDISPTNTGMPYLMEFGKQFGLFPNNAYCELQTVFADQKLKICDGSYSILRTWTVYDWCLPTNPMPPNPNPVYWTQVIKVIDTEGPLVQCPQNVTVSTNPFDCERDYDLPDVIIQDACSRIDSIRAEYVVDGITFTVHGTLSNFPGNNLWQPDTLGALGFANNLPLGPTQMRYIITDDCGNTRACTFNVTVADQTPPVAVCDEITQVSLGLNGEILVNATTFDDGSYDNCSPLSFKARRMDSNNCQSASQFDDQLRFCCDDLGDTVMVVFRAYDVAVPAGPVSLSFQELQANDCMIQVYVDDKIKPVCQAPANVTVSCENFDPSLWAYGAGTATDNCCVDTVTTTVNFSQFDTLCNKGTITRTFRAFDCQGNSSQCTHRIVVNYEQDYFVRFPNDVIVSECDGSGNYGQPTFFGEDCELLAVSFTDETLTVVPDACLKIERTWHIINWCTYNPNLPIVTVPNPNPNAISNHPSNLTGPIVSAPGSPAPWTSTPLALTPGQAPHNFTQYYTGNPAANIPPISANNGFSYKQIIKIIDTEPPVLDCDAVPIVICDNPPNNPDFWNSSAWWDAVHGKHDLCETPSDIAMVGTDSCSGANIEIRYILFLDLDGNGTMETAVSSTNPPAPGTVNFGNAFNPNYTGGEPREFDHRAVPANQKYRFTLQTTVNGKLKTGLLRWNTTQNPNNYVIPLLPYGKHKIKWIANDGCGNETVCEREIIVEDCKPPTVVCLNGLSVNIMPTGMITLWAGDFLQYTEDNCTPANQLQIAVIPSGQSTGDFPVDALGNPITSVTFDCNQLGTQLVQLWSKDKGDNADFCETYVIVQDPNDFCNVQPVSIAGALKTELQDGVEEGSVKLHGSHPALPPISMFQMSNVNGSFQFPNALPFAANYTLTPVKDDNPINGVTTYDLVLISKHILGLEPLNSPYKMIAADANKSNAITTFDIVELRKLILGIYNELPGNESWRFVDKSFVFPNPNNPFATPWSEVISVADVQNSYTADDFVGVKVGDVNNTVIPNGLVQADDRSAGTLLFDVNGKDNPAVVKGETLTLRFRANQPAEGYQFTLNLNGLEPVDIQAGEGMSNEHFAIFKDAVTTSFNAPADAAAPAEFTLTLRAQTDGLLTDMIRISGRITKAEAYVNDSKYDVALRFNTNAGATVNGLGFELYQNTPNPFGQATSIGFHLPESAEATLRIHDEAGRLLYQQNGMFAKGYNSFLLDGNRLNIAGGILYYSIETATDRATRKMLRVK